MVPNVESPGKAEEAQRMRPQPCPSSRSPKDGPEPDRQLGSHQTPSRPGHQSAPTHCLEPLLRATHRHKASVKPTKGQILDSGDSRPCPTLTRLRTGCALHVATAATGTQSTGFQGRTFQPGMALLPVSSWFHSRVPRGRWALPVVVAAVLEVDEHEFLLLGVLPAFQQQDIACKRVWMT